MKNIFKKGDRVFCLTFGGWGEVIREDNDSTICCLFEERSICFTKDGRYLHLRGIPPILSFTEYTLNGFSQERPEQLPKEGDIVWTRNKFPSEWEIGYFFKKAGNTYYTSASKNLQGWRSAGLEIRTTNPYEDEK